MLGTAVGSYSAPQLIAGGALNFSQMFSAFPTATGCTWYGLQPNGTLYAWGGNSSGQLGVGDTTNRSTPTLVIGGYSFSQIAINQIQAYGIATNGTTYAWGNNASGNLGDGTVISKSSPVAVLNSNTLKFVKIFAGNGNSWGWSFGLTASGILYAWGANTYGALGVNDSNARSSPVAVSGGISFSTISVGNDHVLGLSTSGVVYAWGNNTYGQLGDGTVIAKSSPVAVLSGPFGGDPIVQIVAGNLASLAITSKGTMYAWGENSTGKVGDSTTVNKSSPVAVSGGLQAQLSPYIFQSNTPTATTISVTPGSTYNVIVANNGCLFGTTQVAYGPVQSITVSYNQ